MTVLLVARSCLSHINQKQLGEKREFKDNVFVLVTGYQLTRKDQYDYHLKANHISC